MTISRRGLLRAGGIAGASVAVTAAAGAGAAVLVDRGVLPGRSVLNQALGRCDVSVPAPAPVAGPRLAGAFDSVRRRQRVGYVIGYPPGSQPGDRLPVCLVLHGYGAHAADAIDAGRYDRYLAGLVAGGLPPFALAAMDGGGGYWHPHASDDPLGALLDEFVPLLAARGLSVDRLAALGWSMGGFGALLAAITGPRRLVAVAASAPAFWRSYAEAHRVNPHAFDSAAQWSRYDLVSRAGEFRGQRMRIDCGSGDPFAPAIRALRDRLPEPSVVHITGGCHDNAFWQHAAPSQLRLIGSALAGSPA